MTVDDVINYLETIVPGNYKYVLPPEPDAVIAVYRYGGRQDIDLSDVSATAFQLIVRDKEFSVAEAKAVALLEALRGTGGMQIGNRTVCHVQIDEPDYLQTDKANRHEFSVLLTLTTISNPR